MSLPHAPSSPKTPEEWCWYIRRYEKQILVREKHANGNSYTVSLADLPPDRWAFHVAGWLVKNRLPVRVLEQDEIDAKAERVSP